MFLPETMRSEVKYRVPPFPSNPFPISSRPAERLGEDIVRVYPLPNPSLAELLYPATLEIKEDGENLLRASSLHTGPVPPTGLDHPGV